MLNPLSGDTQILPTAYELVDSAALIGSAWPASDGCLLRDADGAALPQWWEPTVPMHRAQLVHELEFFGSLTD
jgi:hypothetical protein